MFEHSPNFLEAIFFDLDGTLFDSLPGIEYSVRHAFEACRLPLGSIDLRHEIGPPIRTILSRVSPETTPSQLDLLEREFRQSYDTEGWQKTPLFPDAVPMLRSASSQGIKLFVVSNKPRHIALKIFEREAITSVFMSIVTRDSTVPPYAGKTQMLEHLLKTYSLHPQRCVMVGDTTEDAHAASSMDIPFAWVSHGYGEISSSDTVKFHIHSFSKLLPTLVKEFAQ